MALSIIGLGAGDISQISYGAMELLKSGRPVYLRTEKHPIVDLLDIEYRSFDQYYDSKEAFEEVYESIAREIIDLARDNDIVYAVPGHPRVAESTVGLIEKYALEEGIDIEIIPSMSFIDAMYNYLGFDPAEGFRLLDAFTMDKVNLNDQANIIVTQVYDRYIASNVKLALMEYYQDDQEVWIVSGAGVKGLERKTRLALYDLDSQDNEFDHLTSVYIPKSDARSDQGRRYKSLEDIIKGLEEDKLEESLRMLDEKLLKAGLELSKTTKDFYGDILNRMVGICKKAEEDLDLDFDLMLEDLSNLIYALVLISKLGSKDGYFDLDELANMAYFSYFNHE